MKVLKFGGTSVGSVASILSLQKIVEKEAKHQPIIVVVSALGGITDQLIATSQLALKGDESWRNEFDSIVARHHKMIDAIITDPHDRESLFNNVDSLFEQLQSIYYGVFLIHDLSHKTEDTIVSYGERLGGYVAVGQLKEIEGFPVESLPFFEVRNAQTKRLNLNTLSLSQLRRHPYITFYMARQIVEYRRLKGRLSSLSQLRLLKEFPADVIERLQPYVCF